MLLAAVGVMTFTTPARAQRDTTLQTRGDSVSIHLMDVEVRTAVQALASYLDRPVVLGNVQNARISVESPRPLPRGDVARLLRSVLESQNMQLVADSAGGVYRVQMKEAPKVAAPPPAPNVMQQGGPVELFVIHLRHARAPDVAATVNALYGRTSAIGEIGARPGTLSRELTAQQVPPGIPAANPAPGVVAGAAGRTATLSGEITIVPDTRGNSLLIRATRADFQLIQAAVQEIDVRPLQVLIEVVIAELRKDRSFTFGVDATLPPTKVNGSQNTTVQGTNTGGGLGDFVVNVMGIGAVEASATLRAATARGDATILSRPVVLAANNEDAEINVGSQRPFVQVSRVLPTDNTARDQVVQYRDVGTRLRVVPTISVDGYVMLQVTQEVNAATAEEAFGAPVISTRSVETRLLIKDGQTIVLGGLTDRQQEHQQGGIPFLSSIPWIGGLFGHVSHDVTETELFLFLTPTIIRGDDDVDDITERIKRKAPKIREP